MPQFEACWHWCPCCKKEYFHQVSEGAPLDTYFSPCPSCRPEGAVASKPSSPPKEIMWADEGEEDGRGALVGIARDAFAAAGEDMPSELELIVMSEENERTC
jgi:hypothetical protein